MLDFLRKKSESTRRKIAFGTSLAISLLIFASWFYHKGYLDYGTPIIAQKSEETSVPVVKNTISSFDSVFTQIGKQYDAFKESVASVLVPFITGIDVYNKGDSK